MNNTLRVVRVSERVPPMPGGKEIHVLELTRVQSLMGDEVEVVFRLGAPTRVAARDVAIRMPDALASRGAISTLGFSVFAALRTLFAERFDTLHLHGDFIEVPALALVARIRRARLVLTVHGALNPRYVGIARLAFRFVDHFIALGTVVADDLLARGVPASRLTVLSSGLNTEMLNAVTVSPSSKGTKIVAVGTLDKVKNHEVLVRAMGQVDADLEIIGDGPEKSRLQMLAAENPRVTFTGQLPRAEVYARVATARLFVMASKPTGTKAEGVPTALLEAMYLKRHCVVSSKATPDPVVTDPASYDAFDPDDPQMLAKVLSRALTCPERSERIGHRAHLAVANLGWETVAGKMREILMPPTAGHVR